MSTAVIARELRDLHKGVRKLESHFLSTYLRKPGIGLPNELEQLDVAAYVVLSHGLFERFVEGLAKSLSTRIVDRWTNGKVAKAGAAALLLRERPPQISAGNIIYDMLRNALDQAKNAMAGTINKNNGISPKHLAKLFHPLGVDVPRDAALVAQIELLIAWRHEWAHRHSQGATVVTSAVDAKRTVDDCLGFATQLADNVRRTWP